MSIENIPIFEKLLSSEYSSLIQINRTDGSAVTLFSVQPILRKTLGMRFDYAQTIRQYILQVSSDSDPNDILHRLDLERVEEQLDQGRPCIVHFTTSGDDGAFCLFEAHFFALDEDCIIMTVRNVTHAFLSVSRNVERLEKALLSTRKEAARRNSFLSLMSRNIRGPLYSIMGLTNVFRQGDRNSIDADDYLRKISMSGSYMSDVIDDILELRQLVSDELVPHQEIFDLKELLEELQRQEAPFFRDRGLIFSVDTENMTVSRIVSDRKYLRQILVKLIRSALYLTVEGGRIQLSVRNIMKSQRDPVLEFSVENRGIVIDREQLSLLFRPYDYLEAGDDSMSDSLGEIDINLLLLRRYLQAMNISNLTAESAKDTGTRITFTVTVGAAEDFGGKPSNHKLPNLFGKRILLVDDNHISREIGLRLLLPRGAEVVTAVNGKDALEHFRKENGRFDLIFMDVLMPSMDGLEATRAIRRMKDIPGAARIPIVAMTVNAFRQNFEESMAAGMNAHLVKPIEPEEFYDIIRRLLGPLPEAEEASGAEGHPDA